MKGIVKSELTLGIASLQPIYEAQMRFSKINIVCGVNSSGKSMLNKLLYCLLMPSTSEGKCITNNYAKNSFKTFINHHIARISLKEGKKDDIALEKVRNIITSILDNWEDNPPSTDYYHRQYSKLKNSIDKSMLSTNKVCIQDIENLEKIVKSIENQDSIQAKVNNMLLESEFDTQNLKTSEKSRITLEHIRRL